VSALYIPFLREIPEGGAILDAGCGSGRDSLAFLRRGYRVVSIDASREMVAATTKYSGQQALLLTFDQIDFTDEFDGIWACGSLVHVARRDLHSVFSRFSRALKPNGVIYLSFQHGDTERMEEERFFNDMNEASLGLFLGGHQNSNWSIYGLPRTFATMREAIRTFSTHWFAGMRLPMAQQGNSVGVSRRHDGIAQRARYCTLLLRAFPAKFQPVPTRP
jgi:SAM-dependent methyltransferase